MKNPNPSKVSRVDELKRALQDSKSVAVVDYTGLNVSQATALRKQVREAGGEIKIEKNTLFKIAAAAMNYDLTNQLTGLSAFVFAKTDEIAPLKVVADFIKKNAILAFKAGLYNDRILSAAEIETLAKTPSRETSIGKLLFLLNYNTSKLVRTLQEIKTQMSKVKTATEN